MESDVSKADPDAWTLKYESIHMEVEEIWSLAHQIKTGPTM